jgi:phosphatidate cytidylyltransferase
MLEKLSILLLVIYVLGTLLTLVLFKFNIPKFIKSSLFKKILMWIPITIIFLTFAMGSNMVKISGFIFLISVIYYEQIKIIFQKRLSRVVLFVSLLTFTIALLHLPLLVSSQKNPSEIIIILAVLASLSDVGAFFCGKFLGFHKLPKILNPHKAWEGVAGQVLGAFIGILLLHQFIFPNIPIIWFLPIGFGSAFGDLYNSFLKRKLGITNWSNILPGHGGFTDRFSSLTFSSLLLYYFIFFTK